jgi:hypothetical protein
LLGAAAAQREALRAPIRRTEQLIVERAVELARDCLGEDGYQRALNEGWAISLDRAAEVALELAREIEAGAGG